MTLVVRWYWERGHLEVEFDEDLDTAIGAAGYGEAITDLLEVWDEEGYRQIPGDEVYRLYRERDEKRRVSPRPTPVAWIVITTPELIVPGEIVPGEAIVYSSYSDVGEAERDLADLQPHLGERVSLRRERPSWIAAPGIV